MGAAYGHMPHIYENYDLSFKDLKHIMRGLTKGHFKKYDVVEKIDGQNLMVTWSDGEIYMVRNKTQLSAPLTPKQFSTFFINLPLVQLTMTQAVMQLKKTFKLLEEAGVNLNKYFKGGNAFLNLEVVNKNNYNVIDYGYSFLQFHSFITWMNGKWIENEQKARDFFKNFKYTNYRHQEYQVVGYRPLENLSHTSREVKNFCQALDRVRRKQEFLKPTSKIKDYLYWCWFDYIFHQILAVGDWKNQRTFQEVLKLLIQRWAFNNKVKNITEIKKMCNKEQAENVDKFEKEKKYKVVNEQFLEPIKDIIVRFGVGLLENLDGYMTSDWNQTRKQIEDKIDYVMDKTGSDKEKFAEANKWLDKINIFIYSPVTEGIVFKYKGKKYKLTGMFPYINNLLAIERYNRFW